MLLTVRPSCLWPPAFPSAAQCVAWPKGRVSENEPVRRQRTRPSYKDWSSRRPSDAEHATRASRTTLDQGQNWWIALRQRRRQQPQQQQPQAVWRGVPRRLHRRRCRVPREHASLESRATFVVVQRSRCVTFCFPRQRLRRTHRMQEWAPRSLDLGGRVALSRSVCSARHRNAAYPISSASPPRAPGCWKQASPPRTFCFSHR